MNTDSPMSMQVQNTALTTINTTQIDRLIEGARQSPRKRMILSFHKSDDDVLHRMLNAIQPQSYIPPHRHYTSGKAESIILLRGSICYFTFSEAGEILQKYHLKAGSFQFGIDTEASVFHTFIALEADTVIYEVKSGPYLRATDKDFPSWSPAENTPEAIAYLQKLYTLAAEFEL